MQPRDRADELLVTTPEHVAFEYDVAGMGSRFLAQFIDLLLLLLVFILFTLAVGVAGAFGGNTLISVLYGVGSFALFLLYFPICEAMTSGQTLGKRAMRLRVVGDRGEPVTLTQVAIRNLIRIVDFLPALYGIGVITLFIQGGAKRLGDFAAGTLVVRERDRIKLKDLVRAADAGRPSPGAHTARKSSIWASDVANQQPPETVIPAVTSGPYELAARRLTPELRRFIDAYSARRGQLSIARREQLVAPLSSALAQLLPREVATYGTLAVLDGLASLVHAPSKPPNSLLPPPV